MGEHRTVTHAELVAEIGAAPPSGSVLGVIARSPADELRVTWETHRPRGVAPRPFIRIRHWRRAADGGWRRERGSLSLRVTELAEVARLLHLAAEQVGGPS